MTQKKQRQNKTKPKTNFSVETQMNTLNQNRRSFFLLSFFIVGAALILNSPEALAVGAAPDAGLTTGVTNLIAILDNKLTPVILIAGCIASLVYSFAIAQPKPFILALVTLCGFGFAKAWITGTYALCG